MVARFDEAGVHFQYPDNWTLEREETESGWTVLVQSPETAFLMLSVRDDAPEPSEMIEAALATLREDYPDLEAEPCHDKLAGRPATGHDISFISLDLTNTCWTRGIATDQGTLLVLCQTNDLEWARHGPVLKAICASLRIEDESRRH
jgi:hypothetical protein